VADHVGCHLFSRKPAVGDCLWGHDRQPGSWSATESRGLFPYAVWTTLLPGPQPGILDLYTVSTGLLGFAVLSVHGAYYVAMKTNGDIYRRACRFARVGGWFLIPLVLINLLNLSNVQPILSHNYSVYPIGYAIPVVAAVALGSMLYFRQKSRDVAAFVASCLFILAGLGITAWAYYPNLLIATTDQNYNLTIYNSAASAYGLKVGLVWFSIGFTLVLGYTIYVHRSFWGKCE